MTITPGALELTNNISSITKLVFFIHHFFYVYGIMGSLLIGVALHQRSQLISSNKSTKKVAIMLKIRHWTVWVDKYTTD